MTIRRGETAKTIYVDSVEEIPSVNGFKVWTLPRSKAPEAQKDEVR